MKAQNSIIDNNDHKKLIRQAHRRGKKTIELDGIVFSIKRVDRKVKYDVTKIGEKEKTHVQRTESWLVVKAVDPRKSRITAQIELKEMGNLRSQF